jgi:hypothetical protein
MKELSIVPDMINSENLIFLDENNIPLTICKKSLYKFTNKFVDPTIIIDNFERGRFKEIEIRNLDISQLIKMGYRLISFKATSETRSRPRQIKCYMLEDINRPIPNSEILYKVPKEHNLEMDTVNNRIRIKGVNAFPYHRAQDASPWMKVVTK